MCRGMNIIALVCLVQKDWHAITVCGIEDTLGDHHNLFFWGGGGGGGGLLSGWPLQLYVPDCSHFENVHIILDTCNCK